MSPGHCKEAHFKDIPRFPYLLLSLYASFSAFYIPPSRYCLYLFSASLSPVQALSFPHYSLLSFTLHLSLSLSDWERHSVWIAASRSRLSPPADSTGLICLLFIKQIRRRGNENIIAIWFPARYFAYWFGADSGISSSRFFFSCFKNWITELGGFCRISLHCWEEEKKNRNGSSGSPGRLLKRLNIPHSPFSLFDNGEGKFKEFTVL